jgi:hypothetical protein
MEYVCIRKPLWGTTKTCIINYPLGGVIENRPGAGLPRTYVNSNRRKSGRKE